MHRMSLLSCFFALCLSLATNTQASSDDTIRWVHKRDKAWCVLFNANEICLPAEYHLTAFKNGSAEFRPRIIDRTAPVRNRPYVDYESNQTRTLTELLANLLNGDTWVQGNTQYHEDLTILELVPSASAIAENRTISLFIMSFGDQFKLKIHGRVRGESENLVRELFAQWANNGDQD